MTVNPWLQPAAQPSAPAEQLPTYLDLWQNTLGWQPTVAQQALFQQLYAQIVAANQQLNLTRITTPEDFWEKHLWDSLSGLAPWLTDCEPPDVHTSSIVEPIRIIDIGTGGGIPGIPAALALAPANLTLVDSTRKKIQFLQTLCQQMNLTATCIAERAETLAQQQGHRERYDLALVRAVGSAATCAEYALPFLKVGGQAVLYRGQWSPADTEDLMPVVDLLGGEITDLQSWQTPLTHGNRNCLFIHKYKPTPPEFPRAVGVPAKKPLT